MYKLVGCSFDNCLLEDDLSIPISTVLTIDEIRRKNIKFVIATGRSVNFVKDYIRDVNFLDYIVALNGSYIYDVIREKVIYEKSLNKATIKRIVCKYRSKPTKIYLFTDNSKCYLNERKEETDEIIIRDLDDFLNNNKVYKIEIHTRTKKYSNEILSELKDEKVNTNFQIYDKKDYFVEINANNTTKYIGMNKVIKKEKITMKDVLFYGVFENDIEMMEKAGLSIAPSNATSIIKRLAAKKTFSNNNKGVEKSLQKIFKL